MFSAASTVGSITIYLKNNGELLVLFKFDNEQKIDRSQRISRILICEQLHFLCGLIGSLQAATLVGAYLETSFFFLILICCLQRGPR